MTPERLSAPGPLQTFETCRTYYSNDASVQAHAILPNVRMLTYAHVCSRILTHADVCGRMLTYADAI
jgi:hypothetical protein